MQHKYDRDTAMLREPGAVQNYLLDRYRLTNQFRDSYAEYMLRNPDNKKIIQAAIDAINKHEGINSACLATHETLIGDLVYTRYVLNFKYWEYFAYGFRNIPIQRRLGFLPEGGRKAYTKILNPSKEENLRFSDKAFLYGVLKEQFKRDAVLANEFCQFDNFKKFVLRHPKFIVKPVRGSLGSGVYIVDASGYTDRQMHVLFRRFLSEKNGMLCEELVSQDPRMAAAHPKSVNTVRVMTYLALDGSVRIICGYFRTGRGSSIVDNAGAGGILAAVDPNSGTVIADAADEAGNLYTLHPDTGFKFKGFQIPRWDELYSTVSECAKAFPNIRMIGWDMALSDSRGWQVIEGNCQSQLNVVQMSTREGMRGQLEHNIEWDVNRKLPK